MVEREINADGESMAKWALHEPGFLGSIKQLLYCARCGEVPPAKGPHGTRRYSDIFKPTAHFICDDCYAALPE